MPKSQAEREGFEAYRIRDWDTATLFLRQAVTREGGAQAESWYMLIMSEMYSEDYAAAAGDCETFTELFPTSPLFQVVQYQYGRSLHFLNQNDKAVLVLSDFCHQNPGSPQYASALYWIAECFYEDFNYETASKLYEQVVMDYPKDPKARDAKFRLDSITQNEREEKLLYLLKMTGEEYLSSKENFEKQLHTYQTEDSKGLKAQLDEANARIKELESENKKEVETSSSSVSQDDLLELRQKAATVERLLKQREGK